MRPALIMPRGLPASGKTTFANQWVASDPRCVRVSRDDIREMLGKPFNRFYEGTTNAIQNAMIVQCLNFGLSVIVDDTNIPQYRAEMMRDIAEICEVEFVIITFDIPLHECLARNIGRERSVPDAHMYRFWEEIRKEEGYQDLAHVVVRIDLGGELHTEKGTFNGVPTHK